NKIILSACAALVLFSQSGLAKEIKIETELRSHLFFALPSSALRGALCVYDRFASTPFLEKKP
ncbi:hypothetical protein, partial [Rahnella variigena]|uniref:hypothetical protein n=1 Tax=Rahnella variigena TaxID=574964 RepID=UPI00244CF03F